METEQKQGHYLALGLTTHLQFQEEQPRKGHQAL